MIVPDGIVYIDSVTIEVTIETENGLRRKLVVDGRTRIELEDDLPGLIADLQVGVEVKVKFNPTTDAALKIEVED